MSTTIRWTVEDLRKIERAFPAQRMELIEGELYSKMGQNPPHAYCLQALASVLVGIYGSSYVRIQLPISLLTEDKQDSEPEPDLAVTWHTFEEYRTAHPSPGQIRLLIEVADTSVDIDEGVKLALYARNGIAEYWVADVNERALLIFTQPSDLGYGHTRHLRGDDCLPLSQQRVGSLFA